MNDVVHASPPRPETAPVKHPASMRTSAGLCTSSCSSSIPAQRTVRRRAGCPTHSLKIKEEKTRVEKEGNEDINDEVDEARDKEIN